MFLRKTILIACVLPFTTTYRSISDASNMIVFGLWGSLRFLLFKLKKT